MPTMDTSTMNKHTGRKNTFKISGIKSMLRFTGHCFSDATLSQYRALLLTFVPVTAFQHISLWRCNKKDKQKKQLWLQTCARYTSCAHCGLHQEKDTCHSPCPGQAVVGTHTDHWSAKARPQPISTWKISDSHQQCQNPQMWMQESDHTHLSELTLTIVSRMKSYSNRFSCNWSTGGKSMKRTPFFASCSDS
jgi:hypothetical protein